MLVRAQRLGQRHSATPARETIQPVYKTVLKYFAASFGRRLQVDDLEIGYIIQVLTKYIYFLNCTYVWRCVKMNFRISIFGIQIMQKKISTLTIRFNDQLSYIRTYVCMYKLRNSNKSYILFIKSTQVPPLSHVNSPDDRSFSEFVHLIDDRYPKIYCRNVHLN